MGMGPPVAQLREALGVVITGVTLCLKNQTAERELGGLGDDLLQPIAELVENHLIGLIEVKDDRFRYALGYLHTAGH